MLRPSSILILTTALAISSQEFVLPPHSVLSPHQCCHSPPLFIENDFFMCGVTAKEGYMPKPNELCAIHLCVFRRNNLLFPNNVVNKVAVGAYLDRWGVNYRPVVAIVKQRCLEENSPLPGSPEMCYVNRLLLCISSTMFAECLDWDPSDDCKALKEELQQIKYALH